MALGVTHLRARLVALGPNGKGEIMTAKRTLLSAAILIAAGSSPAFGQPLPGEALKFQQLPLGDLLTNTASAFPGHDELSTATLAAASQSFTGTFAADDFSDTVSSPVVDVQWWGSYLPNSAAGGQVRNFLISFESNIPAGPTSNFSEPGQVLSTEVVSLAAAPTAGSGTFTETAQPSIPGPDGTIFQYNAELATPFPEVANQIYWLKIVALTTPSDGIQWGWHNRDYTIPDPYAAAPGDSLLGVNSINQPVFHYMDDAVYGSLTYGPNAVGINVLNESVAGPLDYNAATDGFATGIVPPSEDLAFDLYYKAVPEPVALPLLAAGLFLLRRQRRPG
jgi:hypothetical protein